MKTIVSHCMLFVTLIGQAQVPLTLKQTILPPAIGTQVAANLGYSISTNGTLTAVGAPRDDYNQYDAGVVKVFNSATGALIYLIPNPQKGANERFGYSVAQSGTLLVVGARINAGSSNLSGKAFVYDLAGGTPTVPSLTLTGDSDFGEAVAISGNKVVVGSPTYNFNQGKVTVFDLASVTPTIPTATLTHVGGRRLGASVGISGTLVAVGSPDSTSGGFNTSGITYVYNLTAPTPSAPIAILENPTPALADRFGSKVAISDNRLIVGTPSDDTNASDSGSAYLYDLVGGAPTVPVTLVNPTPVSSESFGHSVAIAGSLIVIGTVAGQVAGVNVGEAYVFDATSATPSVSVATLFNPEPYVGDGFGFSIAVSSTKISVGASNDNSGGDLFNDDTGSAYTFDLSGPSPTVPVAKLHNPGPSPGDAFGFAVALSGTRLIMGGHLGNVGRNFYSSGQNYTGSAAVYDLASATPTVPFVIHNPSPDDGDEFGYAVACAGSWVSIAAPRGGSGNIGRVYLYNMDNVTPSTPSFTVNNPIGSGSTLTFGVSLAMSGPRLAIGSVSNSVVSDTGFVSIHNLQGTTPSVAATTLINPAPGALDSFGFSVAISGSLVVVGTPGDDTGAANSGSAYVYDLASATPTVPVATLNNPTPAGSDAFGQGVAISGTRVIVGAPKDDTAGSDAGMIYVYDLSGATPAVPAATLPNPTPQYDRFGESISISGTRVAVGAYGSGFLADNKYGRVYVFELTGTTPNVHIATLNSPMLEAGQEFGRTVAIQGNTVAVGSPGENTPEADKGAAYVFRPANNDSDSDGLLDFWEEAHFGSLSERSALDDGDGDGGQELIEQAFNMNPLLPDIGTLPRVVLENGYLTVTLSKRAGVTYLGQSAATPYGAAFSSLNTTVLIDTTSTFKVRDNLPISAGGTSFLRVKVTATP